MGKKVKHRQPSRRPLLEEIEPRILYSADFAPGLVPDTTLVPDAEQRTVDLGGEFAATAQEAQARRHELVLVETDTPDYQKLVDDILEQAGDGREIEVVLLDAGKDGLQQITDILAARQDLSAVHLVSHGADGTVELGATELNFDALLKNATQIKGWGKSLSADADVLIYGCDVAQQSDGKALIDALARLTGADVAASEDLTGAAAQGGNWTLEYRTGGIDTPLAISTAEQFSYSGTLATYTVTNNNDTGAGSLRQAIQNANANGGADTIAFNIPGAGVKTISVTSQLTITDTVVIDGTTQPSFAGSPRIEIDGQNLGIEGLVLDTGSDGSTIRGLVVNGFMRAIYIGGSSNNVIAGNYLGTDASGTAAKANWTGIFTRTSNNTIGGTTAADRNIISGNSVDGMQISGSAGGGGNVIIGNYIGLDVTGTADLGNSSQGIAIYNGGTNNTIGGTAAGEGNVISGNNGEGVRLINAGTTGNVVLGNLIGTNAAGTAGIANSRGVWIEDTAANNTVGGTAAGAGNTIAYNTLDAVALSSTAGQGNSVLGNAIHSNGGLGIDLKDDGVTANNGANTAGEPNLLIDFPVIQAATLGGTTLTVAGYIGTAPNDTDFASARVEFFKSPSAAGVNGQGQVYLGFLTADTSGNFAGALSVSGLAVGDRITGTATDPSGNTSEFAVNFTVTPNTAPVLADTVVTLNAVNEDAGAPVGAVGTLISALVGGVSDADSGAVEGIAITLADAANGTWFYSLNNGSTWNAMGTPSAVSSRLLAADASTRIYFQPNANYSGTLATAVTFRAWDRTNGSNGGTANTSSNGGTTAFSSATDTASLTVNPVNDAPTITNAATVSLTGTNEDTTSSGTAVNTILTGASWADVDSGALKGIAVTAVTGNGTWQYSTDAITWTNFGAVSGSSALLLDSASQVRYIPDGLNGETATFSFRAWDKTTGVASTNGSPSTANPGAGGGTSAYSSQSASASIVVSAVNDAPTITNAATVSLTGTNENTTSSGTTVNAILTGASWADVDSGALKGIAVTAVTGNGTWQYSTDGVTWTNFGAVSGSSALLLDSGSQVRYVPDGQNGETATFSFKAWDQSTGTASVNGSPSTANPGAGGGSSAYSSQSASASIVVTAVNDAPVLDNSASMSLTGIDEDATANSGDLVSALIASAGGDRITDVDSGAVEGIAVTALVSGNGTWQYSTDGGGSWNAVGAVSNNSALLLRAVDRLRFVPDGLNADNPTVSFRAWDQSSGTQGTKVDASSNGGATAFSSAIETASLTVTAVNDAPVLADTLVSLNAVNEDAGAPVGAVGTLISALVGGVTDVDSGAVEGIAITAADTANGSWWYSTDNGANWIALGSPSAASARLLAADAGTRVYFQPNADYNGTIATAIAFRAWDQSSGSNAGIADTNSNGGTTAFSTATDTASLTVNPINDVPTITAIADQTIAEEGSTAALAFTIGDTETAAGALSVTASSSNTTLIPNANLVLGGAGANRTITVSPAANAYGGPVTITVSVFDGTNTTQETFDVTVTPVADTPAVSNATTNEDTQTTSGLVISRNAADGAEVSHFKITGITGGTLYLNDGTTVINNGDFIAFVQGNAGLKFTPSLNSIANGSFDVQASTAGNDSGLGGGVVTATVTVNAVNDAPVLAGANNLTAIPEDPAADPGTLVSALISAQVTDPDAAALSGIAVTAVDNSNGTWEYSTDGGTSWNSFGTPTPALARLLAADASTYVRFVPNVDWNGTVSPGITFRAWDQTSGTAGGTADASSNGGSTAFSSASAGASITVTAVNDAPSNNVPAAQLTPQDTALVFSSGNANAISIGDVDAGSNPVEVTLTGTNGAITLAATAGLTFSLGSGVADTTMTFTGTIADINAALNGMSFAPTPGYTGAASLAVTTDDLGSSGAGGALSSGKTVNITVTSTTAPTALADAYSVNEDGALSVAWWDSAWTRREQITFTGNTFGGAQSLTDFPVLVTLNSGNIDYALTQNAGQDLRFFDANGAALAYEIETWNESGNSYVWVKVPQIDTTGTDSITMYYGNASAAAGQDPDAVWSSNGYRAVYHLSETGATVGDSTVNAFDGTASSGASGAAGRIGGGFSFDGANDRINLGSSLPLINSAGAVTLSAWVRADSTAGDRAVVAVGRYNGGTPTVNSRASITVVDDEIEIRARSTNDDSDTATVITTDAPLAGSIGVWRHLTAVIDYTADTVRIYLDGVQDTNTTGTPNFTNATTPATNSANAAIGSEDDGSNSYFDGTIDEVRVSQTGRSAAWIRAEYLSMTNALVTVGGAQAAPGTGGVLANDTSPGGRPLSAVLVGGPGNASAFALNADGTFSYTPVANFAGTDTFTYQASDGSGTSNTATVTITVNAINDEPGFSLGGNQTVLEDAGPQAVVGFATPSAGGGTDELSQTFAYTVGNDNNALFAVQPGIDASGNLTYTLSADTFGSATVTVFVTDSGGTAGGGDNTSASQTFTITVNPVADTPSVTGATTAEDTQTTSGLVISRSAADGAEVSHFKITGIAGGTLYQNDGTSVINNGDFLTFAQANAGLKFTPSANSTANGSFQVQASTANNDTGLGGGVATATITVNPVNDAPVVGAGAITGYGENAAAVAIDNSITINDVDDTQITGATVSISAGLSAGDVLGFANTANITGVYNAGTGVLTLTGTDTLAAYQAALRTVTYTSTSEDPTALSVSRTLVWQVTDANAQGSGAQTSAPVTSTVNLSALADAPVVTAGAITAYTENAAPVAIDNTVTVSDADDTQIAGATVTITAGLTAGDVLGFTNTASITGVYNAGTGVLTLTGADTLAAYQAALRSVTYGSTSEDPTAGSASRTIDWQVSDANSDGAGAASSAAVTSTVNLTALADAPVVTAGATTAYTETAGAVAIDSTLTIADADDTQIAGATVAISAGLTAGDVLGFTNTASIAGVYNAGTGVLTLTGTDSLANYQAALRSVTYSSSSEDPTALSASRTVSWQVTDADSDGAGAQTSAVVTSTVNLTALADAPVVTAGATAAYTENAAAVVIDNTITIGDVDDTQIAGATVAISAGLTAGDVLGFVNTAGITGVYNAGTGVLTLSGTDTLANYRAALRSVTYSSTSEDPTAVSASRTIDWQVTDANSDGVGAQSSAVVTSTVNLTALADAPVVTAGAVTGYTENAAAVAIDTTITINDADDTQIAGATVTISAGLTAGDVLVFVNTASIAGVYNAGTGVLTLTGTDTLANYQAALRSVTYSSTSDDPTASSTSRTIDWQVTDANSDGTGPQSSAVATSTVNLTALADAPVVTAGATTGYAENAAAVAIDTTITINDADDTQIAGAMVTINAGLTAGDVLGFVNTASITGVYNAGTGVLTLSGTDTLANYQAALRSVTYSSTSDDPTASSASRTIDWQVTDANSDSTGAQSSAVVTSTVNLTALADAPVITAGAVTGYTENAAAVAIDNSITINDADDTQIAGATVTISAGLTAGDVLGFVNTASITGVYNAGTGVLTLTGTDTLANYQIALRSVTYSSTSEDPTVSSVSRTISWQVTDADSDGAGAASSAVVTSTVNLTALADAPVLTAGAAAGYTENAAAVTMDNTITVNDVDDTQIAGATITISAGLTAGDVLGFVNTASITGVYNAGTGVLTLTGTDSLANYQAALRSVMYSSTSENPTAASASRTIAWQVTDANSDAAGPASSVAVTSMLNVTAVNDAPVLGANALTIDQGGSVLLAAGNLSASDVDDPAAGLSFSVGNVTNGRFEYTSTPGVAITTFTRAEVTGGLVRFVHDGGGNAPAYEVTVSDGSLTDGPWAASITFNPLPLVVILPPVPAPVLNEPPPVDEPPADEAPANESEAAARPADSGAVQAVFSPGRIEVDAPEAQFNGLEGGGALGRRYQPVATLNTFVAGPRIDPTLQLLAAAPANLQYLPSVPVDWTTRSAFPDAAEEQPDRIQVLLEQVQMGGMALSVGVVWWASRISGLLGSLLASAPAWRHIDPLPVVGRDEDEDKKWYDPEDRDADANELAIANVLEGAAAAGDREQA